MPKEKILSVIDVGSSKVATLIASIVENNQVQIVGVSSIPAKGVKKSVIVDIDQAVEAISESLAAAERMAGYAVSQAFVSIGGVHINSLNSSGVVAVSQPQGEIRPEDIERVTEAAKAISIPSSREIIHVIPRFFMVDSQEGIHDPVGMSGVRLEAQTHIITGAVTSDRNLIKCINQVGVDVESLVFSGLAAAQSTLSETEKELGVALVDIGGGTTNIVLFTEGAPAYSTVIPIGGKNITNDLAIGLRTSLEDAEKIKIFISKYRPPVSPNKTEEDNVDISDLKIPDLKTVDRRFIRDGIIKPRLEEVFEGVEKEIVKSGFGPSLPSGMVLTGGGALTVGAVEVAKRISRTPVRIGQPIGVSGLIDEISSPVFASSIGMIIFANQISSPKGVPLLSKLPKIGELFSRVIEWVKGLLP